MGPYQKNLKNTKLIKLKFKLAKSWFRRMKMGIQKIIFQLVLIRHDTPVNQVVLYSKKALNNRRKELTENVMLSWLKWLPIMPSKN